MLKLGQRLKRTSSFVVFFFFSFWFLLSVRLVEGLNRIVLVILTSEARFGKKKKKRNEEDNVSPCISCLGTIYNLQEVLEKCKRTRNNYLIVSFYSPEKGKYAGPFVGTRMCIEETASAEPVNSRIISFFRFLD